MYKSLVAIDGIKNSISNVDIEFLLSESDSLGFGSVDYGLTE